MPPTSPPDPNVWARQRVDRVLAGRDGGPLPLVAVMIASMDGSAAIDGKSGGLSSAEDRALVRAWRRATDVLLVGGRTLEVETYASILPEEDRAFREARGQAPVPLIATLSRRLSIDFERVLSAQQSLGLVVYTEVEPPATPPGPNVRFVQLPSADPTAVVADVVTRFAPGLIVSEGGPKLLSHMLDAGLVTDLSLTLAPLLVAGSAPVIDHGSLTHPLAFTIADSEQVGDFLFPHYRLAGG